MGQTRRAEGSAAGTVYEHNATAGAQRLGVAISEAVATVTGRDPCEGPPLQRVVDVDALQTLVDTGRPDLRASFDFEDVRVTVHGDGRIAIQE